MLQSALRYRTLGEGEGHFKKPALPQRLLLARDSTLPRLEIQNARLRVTLWFSVEAKGVVAAPLLPGRVISMWH